MNAQRGKEYQWLVGSVYLLFQAIEFDGGASLFITSLGRENLSGLTGQLHFRDCRLCAKITGKSHGDSVKHLIIPCGHSHFVFILTHYAINPLLNMRFLACALNAIHVAAD